MRHELIPPKPYTLVDLYPDRRNRKRRLSKIDTTVPLRSEGRSSDHTEIYSIVWMLRSAPLKDLSYPIKVIHTDRPDFQLQSSNTVIGIEVTEAVSANAASMDKIRESEPHLWRGSDEEPAIYFPHRHILGEEKFTAKYQRQLIIKNQPGEPWCGTGAETWAVAISHFATAKIKKTEGYSKFDQNWLLIYDNWNEPGRRIDLADAALDRKLHEMDIFDIFNRVMILDGHSLAIFCQNEYRRIGRRRHGK